MKVLKHHKQQGKISKNTFTYSFLLKMNIRFNLVILILFFHLNTSWGQSENLGTWNILNLKYKINKKWSVLGEGQVRSLQLYSNFHYIEYKSWMNYQYDSHMGLSLGVGNYQTFNENGNFRLPRNNNEIRIWPQITLNQTIGLIRIEQRYRAECRFTSSGYRNRFRYRVGLALPLGKTIDGFKHFQLNASNELFFTDKEPYFERNRIVFSLNYKPNLTTVIQVGYLHQFDYKINDETGRDFLQIGFFFELFHKPSEKEIEDIDLKDN